MNLGVRRLVKHWKSQDMKHFHYFFCPFSVIPPWNPILLPMPCVGREWVTGRGVGRLEIKARKLILINKGSSHGLYIFSKWGVVGRTDLTEKILRMLYLSWYTPKGIRKSLFRKTGREWEKQVVWCLAGYTCLLAAAFEPRAVNLRQGASMI